MRFGVGFAETRTLAEIGDALGISRERVRQIETEAIGALRRDPAMRQLFRQMS
jgi:RNA polymerase primary sigma factor